MPGKLLGILCFEEKSPGQPASVSYVWLLLLLLFFCLFLSPGACNSLVWGLSECWFSCLALPFCAPSSSTPESDGFGNGRYDGPAHPGSKSGLPPTACGEIRCAPELPWLRW